MNDPNTTSQQIHATALRILEAEGPQAVSMGRVAKEVGITAMAIYQHFASREALLSAVVDAESAQLVGFFRRSNTEQGFEAAMIHIMDGYIDYALAHPRIFDYVFAAHRSGARRFSDDFRAGRSPTLNLIAAAVRARIRLGKLKRDDVWEISMELWARAGQNVRFRVMAHCRGGPGSASVFWVDPWLSKNAR